MQTEHIDEIPQRELEDEDLEQEAEGEEQGDEDQEGDNARAGQQLGGFEPLEEPQVPTAPMILPEHRITEPTEKEARTLDGDLAELLADTLQIGGNSGTDFANNFQGELVPLRPLAKSTWENVQKLGRVKPTVGQRMAFGHNRNYQRFTGWAKEKTDKAQKKRQQELAKPVGTEGEKSSGGFNPILGIGSIFWGDYGRYKRHQRDVKKGRAKEGSTTEELMPGEATTLAYRRTLEQRIRPLIQPLLQGMRSIAASMQTTLPGGYEAQLLTFLAPQIAHKSSIEILTWIKR